MAKPDVICPPGAFDEEEPDCYDGYEDETNGGCSVLAWSYPGLNTFICGTTGNYNDNSWRDMDWFEVTLAEPKVINWCICAEFAAGLWVVDGREELPDDRARAGDLLVHYLDRRLARHPVRIRVRGGPLRGGLLTGRGSELGNDQGEVPAVGSMARRSRRHGGEP